MWTQVGATMATVAAAVGLLGCGLQASGVPVIQDPVYMASSAPAAEQTTGPAAREALALKGISRAP